MQRYATLLLVVLSVASLCGATAILTSRYILQHHRPVSVFTCAHTGPTHQVVIENSQLSVAHVDAKLCDTLTLINKDTRLRVMAFGQHDNHQAYDGVTEQVLAEGQSLTVTLNQLGTF